MKATLKPLRENPSEENKAKAKEIRASYKDKLSPMKISIKDIRDGFDNSLLEILSKDQGKKYLKLKALKVKQKESHKGKGLHGKPSPRSK